MARNETNDLPKLDDLDTHPEITTALLTCIAAGYKHLIIRTSEEDIGRVKGLAISALSSLTGPLTQRLRAKEHHTPLSFLQNILVTQPTHNPDQSFTGSHSSGSRPAHSPSRSKHRTSSPAGSPNRPAPHTNVQPLDQAPTRTLLPSQHPVRPQPQSHRRSNQLPRVPHALVASHLEVTSRAVQQTLVDTLRTRIITIDEDVGENFENLVGPGRWNLPLDFLLVYVYAGGRDDRERPPIIKPLIDLFGYGLTVVLTEQSLGNPSSPHYPSPPSLTQEATKRMIEVTSKIQIPLPLQVYMSSLVSAARHHHQLDGTFLTLRAHRDFEILLKAASVVTRMLPPPTPSETNYAPTAVDAAKLFIRIVTHRLRVRDGPQDELLAPLLWGTENEETRPMPEQAEHARRSVCDIIVEDILTAV